MLNYEFANRSLFGDVLFCLELSQSLVIVLLKWNDVLVHFFFFPLVKLSLFSLFSRLFKIFLMLPLPNFSFFSHLFLMFEEGRVRHWDFVDRIANVALDILWKFVGVRDMMPADPTNEHPKSWFAVIQFFAGVTIVLRPICWHLLLGFAFAACHDP